MKRFSHSVQRHAFVQLPKFALAGLLLVIASALPALAGTSASGIASGSGANQNDDNQRVIVPSSATWYGKTYGEWSAEHWKWLYSMPVDRHPLFDTADCSEDQSGPVWFLGGTFIVIEAKPGVVVGNATRNCTVPGGKSLFFPILDSECGSVEGNGTTDAELRACAKASMDHVTTVTCEIDGVTVTKLEKKYRVQSPLFTFGPLPENNVLQAFGLVAPAGTTSLSVSDGIFLMVAPLSTGDHTIHFTGSLIYTLAQDGFDFSFSLDITYNLTVLPEDQQSGQH